MNTTTKQILYWSPRVLGILFAIFISLFALDVFGEGNSFGETMLALLIHLVPTFLIVIALIVAWRRERLGTILFAALMVAYLIMSRGEGWIIAGPLLLIAMLFLLNGIYKAQLKT